MITDSFCKEVQFCWFLAMQECIWSQRQHGVFYEGKHYIVDAMIHDSATYKRVP